MWKYFWGRELRLIPEMKQLEKISVTAAAILFLAVLGWTFLAKGPSAVLDSTTSGKADFEPEVVRSNISTAKPDWGQPVSQGGANWIFDIFTPPVIFYDEATQTFTVTPPFPDANPVERTFELRLVAIEPQPFRFQLVSYAGARGNYVLTLENLESGRDVFCSPGEALTEYGLRILDFAERREIAASTLEGTTEAFDLTGEVTVQDERNGKQYKLRHTATTYLENPLVRFVSTGGQTVLLKPGESWESGTAEYVLKSLDAAKQTATVEKTSLDVSDKVIEILHTSSSFNSSDLSNRSTRLSDPQPGAF
jgi:hypothetical protein